MNNISAGVRRTVTKHSAHIIGGIQIQSRASIGGNLCNASPAADSSPALMALGATVVIGSSSGTRTIPVEQLFAGPGRNSLASNELLLQIRIPAARKNENAFYLHFIPRNEMDIAVASAGARLQLDDAAENIVSARLAIGAVGPTPLMVPVESIIGKPANEATFRLAGAAAAATATPITDMRGSVVQRKQLASVLTVRALNGALQRIREAR